jgi:isopentenyl-diphosphate delta-isomerase
MTQYGAPPTDEWLDLVDESDAVVGRMRRSEIYAKGLTNFRVVNAFVVNVAGEFWIPRRTAHKRLFPNSLDVSIGGHVESGEDYDAAFRREAMEELRINVDAAGFREIARMTPASHPVSAFMRLYLIGRNGEPDFNRDDFSEAFWLSPDELLRRIADGEPCKGDLPALVRVAQSVLRNSMAQSSKPAER